jgi:2'-5' RNA ligase
VRLFVALELPGAAREALARWARAAAGGDPALRLVGVDALHVTLAFLGEREPGEVAALTSMVQGAGPPATGLATGPVLWLAPRRPHVMTVAVDDTRGELAALHATVWHGLAPLGFTPETRAFRPHVTVARVRRGDGTPRRDVQAPPHIPFDGSAVSLMRSHIGSRPARYEVLASSGAQSS